MCRLWKSSRLLPAAKVRPKNDTHMHFDPVRHWLLPDGHIALRQQRNASVHRTSNNRSYDRLFRSNGTDLRELLINRLLLVAVKLLLNIFR